MRLFDGPPRSDPDRSVGHSPPNGGGRAKHEARYLDEEEPDDRTVDEHQEQSDRSDKREAGNGAGAKQRTDTRPTFSGAKAIRLARQYLSDLTGQVAESVSALSPFDGGWKVTLDVVELERIPHTTDVLASYELQLDEHGELMGYRRVTRYYRSQADEG